MENIKSNKNIYLFDLDGTLINSAPEIIKTYNAVFLKHNIKPTREVSIDLIGPPLKETMSMLVPFDNEDKLKNLINDFIDLYDDKFCYESKLYKGTYEMLNNLSKQKRLIIITNKRLIPTEKILSWLGIKHFFEKCFSVDSNDQLLTNKSLLIKNVLKSMKLDEKKCIYIGDTESDFDASRDNNIDFIFAKYGYGDSKIKFLNEIDDISDLDIV